MGQRGRPPYPDILTPRQWEVLDLLRAGLSDHEIADRLAITLAGAKYHVSEILTKLGVASPEEAATWQPPEAPRPWWQRALALSLLWKTAAVAVVVSAAVGIGVLAWGVAQTESDSLTNPPVFEDLHLPPPLTSPTLTRETFTYDSLDIRAMDIQVSTAGAIKQAVPGISKPVSDDSTAWLIRLLFVGDECAFAVGCPRVQSQTRVVKCRTAVVFVPDGRQGPSASIQEPITADGACDGLPRLTLSPSP